MWPFKCDTPLFIENFYYYYDPRLVIIIVTPFHPVSVSVPYPHKPRLFADNRTHRLLYKVRSVYAPNDTCAYIDNQIRVEARSSLKYFNITEITHTLNHSIIH